VSIALDANILLHASDDESPYRDRAVELIDEVARGPQIVYIFWPTLMAYLRIATHPAIFASPLPLARARHNVDQLLALPHVRTASESEDFWDRLRDVLDDAFPTGNLVPDAHVVALMHQHGVRSIWTRDRGFRRFRGIEIRDPFAA
jgi:uncharacterized protein